MARRRKKEPQSVKLEEPALGPFTDERGWYFQKNSDTKRRYFNPDVEGDSQRALKIANRD